MKLSLNIDQFNIALMLLACAAAYFIPFEVLLLSYALLGPAHYLTQISWMHDRRYFTSHKGLWVPASLIVALLMFLWYQVPLTQELKASTNYIIYIMAFAGAASLALIKNFKGQLFTSCLLIGLFLVFLDILPAIALPLILLVPTVVHIYVFTGAFILQGALKTGSSWGYSSFFVFLACGLFFFCAPNIEPIIMFPSFSMNHVSFFDGAIGHLQNLVSFGGYIDPVSIFGFLGFSYTYHYLNWFSKAEIIKWNQFSKRRLLAISSIYCASVALYIYDYKLGFVGLLFLSLLHVVLEFPLNALTFRNIWKMIWMKILQKEKHQPI